LECAQEPAVALQIEVQRNEGRPAPVTATKPSVWSKNSGRDITTSLPIRASRRRDVHGSSSDAFVMPTAEGWHDHSRRYLFLNADVNHHYRNEVTFAGRYLGADPDPAIRLNLRIDRPDA
jgi:hypothetical protein